MDHHSKIDDRQPDVDSYYDQQRLPDGRLPRVITVPWCPPCQDIHPACTRLPYDRGSKR